MASGILTTTTHEDFIPEVWAAKSIDAYEKKLVLAGLIENVNELFANGGDTAILPIFKNLGREDIQDIPETKQAVFDPQLTDADSVELVIDRKKYASVEISDPLQVFSSEFLVGKYSAKLGQVLAEYVDYDLAGLYAASAHEPIELTGLAEREEAEIVAALNKAVTLLDEKDVPAEDRAFVLDPALYGAVRTCTAFSSIDFTDAKAMQSGLLGEIFGVPVYRSTNLRTSDDSGDTITHCLLLHKSCAAWADPSPITTKLAGSDGRFVHAQITSTVYYGFVSTPRDGEDNNAIIDIQVS